VISADSALVLDAIEALHAAEKRQLALGDVVKLIGEPRKKLLTKVLQNFTRIRELLDSPSEAQRSLLEAHCADTSILLALLVAQP
jgi:hypothetical protein